MLLYYRFVTSAHSVQYYYTSMPVLPASRNNVDKSTSDLSDTYDTAATNVHKFADVSIKVQ